jgi:hypothetical protein
MTARTVDLLIAVGFLIVGLVPLVWPGAGPVVVSVLLQLAGLVGSAVAQA